MGELRGGHRIGGFEATHQGNIRTQIQAIDGPSSGIDADTVDGFHLSDIQNDAQTKMISARDYAINWAKGFGLGTNAMSKSGTDLNAIVETGFYRADRTANTSNVPPRVTGDHNWIYIIHVQHDSSWMLQYAFDFNNVALWTRTKISNTWGAWKEIESVNSAQAKANTAETNAKNYVDNNFFQKQQLTDGQKAIIASGDWNNYTSTGFYMGTGMTNEPTATGIHPWKYVMVIVHLSTYVMQVSWDFSGTYMFTRAKVNGTWSAWRSSAYDDKVVQKSGDTMTGNLVMDSSSAEKQVRFLHSGTGSSGFFHNTISGNTGMYDWASSKNVWSYNKDSQKFTVQAPTTFDSTVGITNTLNVGDVNVTKTLRTKSIGNEDKGLFLSFVEGGSFLSSSSGASSITGAIAITLPQSWTSTMMQFTVDVYELSTGETFSVLIGGYNYSNGSRWDSVSAIILGANVNRNFTVRFGHDGTNCVVYIGETNSVWNYPQITVRDFGAGYSNATYDKWATGWNVGFVTTLGTISATVSETLVKSSYALNADMLDGLHESTFARKNVSLTGGTGIVTSIGDLSTNRTISLDTAWTDNRYTKSAGDTMTGNLTFDAVSGERRLAFRTTSGADVVGFFSSPTSNNTGLFDWENSRRVWDYNKVNNTFIVNPPTTFNNELSVKRVVAGDEFISTHGTIKLDPASTNARIEFGSTSSVSTPYLDFHSSGTNNDYDARITASGGTATIGQGKLTVTAGQIETNAPVYLNKSSEALRFTGTHGFAAFFVDSANPTVRSGWFGYGTTATPHMTLYNERTDGEIQLNARGNVNVINNFNVGKDASVNGTLNVSTSGIAFPDNPYGGAGDKARIYIQRANGATTGEDMELAIEVQNDATDRVNVISNGNSSLKVNGNTVWNAGNHGPGSGMNADLLDGLHESSFARKATTLTGGTGIVTSIGDLSANRTISLDTAYTDGRYVKSAGDTMTGHLTFDSKTVERNIKFLHTDGTNVGFFGNASGAYGMWDWGPNKNVFTYKKDDRTLTFSPTTIFSGDVTAANVAITSATIDNAQTKSLATTENGTHLAFVQGGRMMTSSGSASVTGAIAITLPQSWTSTMMTFTVDIFDYATNRGFSVFISGYNYDGSSTWINTGAVITGGNVDRNFTVRFGHDGTKCVVYIGDVTTKWSYPQVTVRNVTTSYNNFGADKWASGWKISMVTELLNVVSTINDTLTKSSYAINADMLDGVHESSFARKAITLTGGTGITTSIGDLSANRTISFDTTWGDARYINKTGDSLSGDLTISKTNPVLKLHDSDAVGGTYPRIEFSSTASQNIQLRFNEIDGEILDASGYALILEKAASNGGAPKASLQVEGNIYSDGVRVMRTNENAVSATKLATARTIALTGDVTGSVSFDGTGNATINTTYKNSGVTAGQYSLVTVDAKGNITAGSKPSKVEDMGVDKVKYADGTGNYVTSSTGGTYSNQWTKIATLKVVQQYAYANTEILLMGGSDGGSVIRKARISARLKQQNALGQIPSTELILEEARANISKDNFAGVITTNSVDATVMEIYVRIPVGYETFAFTPIIQYTNMTEGLTFHNTQGFLTDLPTGRVISCDDPNLMSTHQATAATTTSLGHVRTGDGIANSSGLISVDTGDGVTLVGTTPNKKVQADVDGSTIILSGTSPNKKIAHADTSNQASISNSGATVIQSVGVDGMGHVTSMSSKTLTYSDVSAVPASDVVTSATANKILKLDGSGKLPASITGNAESVNSRYVDDTNTGNLILWSSNKIDQQLKNTTYNQLDMPASGDLNDFSNPNSFFSWDTGAGQALNTPLGTLAKGSSKVFVVRNYGYSGGRMVQEFTTVYPTNSITTWVRTRSDTNWGTWLRTYNSGNMGSGSGLDADKLDGVELKNIMNEKTFISSGDLNTFTETGIYSIGGADWSGFTNAPTTAYNYGMLIVNSYGNVVTQVYYPHGASGGTRAMIYRSKYNASDWGAWITSWNNLNFDPTSKADISTTISAGAGLTGGGSLAANRSLAVSFAGTGSATTVARSDHNHDTRYVYTTGDTMTGDLLVDATSAERRMAFKTGTGTIGFFSNQTSNNTGLYDWENNRRVWDYNKANNTFIVAPTATFNDISTKRIVSSGDYTTTGALFKMVPSGTTNAGMEIGSTTGGSTPFIDFHSSGNDTDYDTRIIASGGNTTSGQGKLTIYSGLVESNGPVYVNKSAEALRINGTSGNHGYMTFYQDGANPTTRSGWIGYGSSTSNTMSINNDTGATINLVTTGVVNVANDFNVNKDASVGGTLNLSTSGIAFPDNPFGGSGDTARIYLQRVDGATTGEDMELVINVQNDPTDRVNVISNGNSSLKVNGNTVWNAGNMGAGSGLDADKLDGLHESSFARKAITLTGGTGITTSIGDLSANRTISLDTAYTDGRYANVTGQTFTGSVAFSTTASGVSFPTGTPTVKTSGSGIYGGSDAAGLSAMNNVAVQTWYGFSVSPTIANQTVAQGTPAFSVNARTGQVYAAGNMYANGTDRVLTTADEGSGKGIDADTVDGVHESSFARKAITLTGGTGITTTIGDLSANRSISLDLAYTDARYVNLNGASNTMTGNMYFDSKTTGKSIRFIASDGTNTGFFGNPDTFGMWDWGTNKNIYTYRKTSESLLITPVTTFEQDVIVSGTLKVGSDRVLTTADEGSGKGIDADTLDGLHETSFARKAITLTGGTGITTSIGDLSANRTISFDSAWGDGRYVNLNGANNTMSGTVTFGSGQKLAGGYPTSATAPTTGLVWSYDTDYFRVFGREDTTNETSGLIFQSGDNGDDYFQFESNVSGTVNRLFRLSMVDGGDFKVNVNAPAFVENGTSLNNKYLGINAKADNSGQLNGASDSTDATANTIAKRDSSGDIRVRLLRPEYTSTSSTPNYFLVQHAVGAGSADNYARPSSIAQVRNALGGSGSGFDADTLDGNHASAFALASTTLTGGTGIKGIGDLSGNRTISLDTAYTDDRYVNTFGDTMTGGLTVPAFSNTGTSMRAALASDGSGKAINVGAGPTDTYISNTKSGKFVQLKDDGNLTYNNKGVVLEQLGENRYIQTGSTGTLTIPAGATVTYDATLSGFSVGPRIMTGINSGTSLKDVQVKTQDVGADAFKIVVESRATYQTYIIVHWMAYGQA